MTLFKYSTTVILTISTFLLSACQPVSDSTHKTDKSDTLTQQEIQTFSEQDLQAYHEPLTAYQSLLTPEGVEQFDTKKYNGLAHWIATNTDTDSTTFQYGFSDIDNNGVKELFITYDDDTLLDIYTLDKSKTVKRLTTKELGLEYIGDIVHLEILDNYQLRKRLPGNNGFEYTFLTIAPNGTRLKTTRVLEHDNDKDAYSDKASHNTLSAKKFNQLGTPLDLTLEFPIQWFSVTKPLEEVIAERQEYADFFSGDYSRLAGTWINSLGQTFTVDANGQILDAEENLKLQKDWSKVQNGFWATRGRPSEVRYFTYAPAGVIISYNGLDTDESDTSRERMLAFFKDRGDYVYYRME